jgi:dTDP-4-amino-4,6-dideoxygalactose transaminase
MAIGAWGDRRNAVRKDQSQANTVGHPDRSSLAHSLTTERIVFGAPYIGEEEIQEVVDTLRSGWIGTGPRVAQFQRDFADYKGAQHAIAVNSCTAALHLSLIAAGVGPGDEVITTPLTFCATVNSIIHVGAKPVLVDVDPITMNIDATRIVDMVTPKTKAIVPVHFAGLPCDMNRIMAIARGHNLKVIEDCAHAIETQYQGRPAGTIGDFGCFSFYSTKNITTCEGGMILARDEQHAEQLRRLALHGMSKDAWRRFSDSKFRHYSVTDVGFKYNMTDLCAAIGLHQLRRIENSWLRRREIWQHYMLALSDLPLALPTTAPLRSKHGHHLYTVLIDPQRCGIDRERFIEELDKREIGVGIHYLCLAEHPVYQTLFGWRPEDFPNATRIGRQTVSLPLSAGLSSFDVARVAAAVREIVAAA